MAHFFKRIQIMLDRRMCSIAVRIVALLSLWPVSSIHVLESDIVLNPEKGYALHRIGRLLQQPREAVVHSFIHLNDSCATISDTAVCQFVTGVRTMEMIEVATNIAENSIPNAVFDYDIDQISRLTRIDLAKYLIQKRFFGKFEGVNAIDHLIEDHHFTQKNQLQPSLIDHDSSSVNSELPEVPRFKQTTLAFVLNEVQNRKVTLEYVNGDEMKIFLDNVFRLIDSSYKVLNIRESLTLFNRYVIGQSIFIKRHCTSVPDSSSLLRPCLIVSTLFIRAPRASSSMFTVYRMIALPALSQDDIYVYENIPKFVGISQNNLSTIAWISASDVEACIFSNIVMCKRNPMISMVANFPCLSYLLDDKRVDNIKCEITRSVALQTNNFQIGNGLWLFHNRERIQSCQVYSMPDNSIETIYITEATIVVMPCAKSIVCDGDQLPISPCSKQRISVVSQATGIEESQPKPYYISLVNVTKRLVTQFKRQNRMHHQRLIDDVNVNQSPFLRFTQDTTDVILSIASIILLLFILLISHYLKFHLAGRVETLQNIVFDVVSQ
jgi:hypothetical protein